MMPSPARRTALSLAALACAAAPLALAAQEQPGSFELPRPTPAPSPAPAGPADERAGVAIPPRAAPSPRIEPVPVLTPEPLPPANAAPTFAPRPRPNASRAPLAPPPGPVPGAGPGAAPAGTPAGGAAPAFGVPAAAPSAAPAAAAAAGSPAPLPAPVAEGAPATPASSGPALPAWWPYAAGGLGALALLLGGAFAAQRRRRPKMPRLAAPAAAPPIAAARAEDLPRLDLALEITEATRSLMMFTLAYRLTIANRSERAVNDLAVAGQLACARAGTANAPSPGAAQSLAGIARVGPHQARSISGEVQIPLAAIQPLRQGTTPLFVPLLHLTLEGEGQRTMARSFVIGTPSASGRVHPIPLDRPPGRIEGLVAQAVAVPPAPATTTTATTA